MNQAKPGQAIDRPIQDSTTTDTVPESNKTLLPYSNKSCSMKPLREKLSSLAKELIEDCYKDKISLNETTVIVNQFCQNVYSMKQVGKYIRRLRSQEARKKIIPLLKKRTTNLPYVTNYLPVQRNELKKIPKEKKANKQELIKAPEASF